MVIALGDPRAASGSDAGGKLATIKVMAHDSSWSPDIGYWAERWDPDGDHHPIYYTDRRGEDWVQVTTLPFVYLGVPLWHLGGEHGVLLLPIAGSVLAAVAARRLARLVGGRDGWVAFWLVGAASPLAFYAADFWEHSMGVGLALLAFSLALSRRTVPAAAAAGALLGLGGVLRTETLAYAAAFGLAALVVGEERREWLRRPFATVAAAVAGAAVLVLNSVAEEAVVGAAVRASRVASNVSAAGTETDDRLRDSLVTTFALFPDSTAGSYLLGGLIALSLVVLGVRIARGVPAPTGPLDRAASALPAGLYLVRIVDGLGFVPGLFAASPAAAAGVGASVARDGGRATRVLALTALIGAVAVYAFQWRGQLVPQWGGRYLLVSAALLTIIAGAVIEQDRWRRWPAAVVVGLAVTVTAFGVIWHADRTRSVAAAGEALYEIPDDVVVVSTITHLGRELGAFHDDRRWLTAVRPDDLDEAAAVAAEAGAPRIDVVELPTQQAPPQLSGWELESGRTVDFLGFPLRVSRYAAR